MKIVHAADLHLDSPLRGLPAHEGAPVERVREATRKAFRNLIDLCLKEKADALLLAGDVFDGDWKDFSTGLFFGKELERLRPMPVFLVRGNHDAMSEVTRQLRLPPHVREFPEDAAATIVVESLGLAVHGLSFSRRVQSENLVPKYPAPRAGLFNVGILHTSCEGRPNHNPYAPCRVEELVAKGYDYWALGHVHAHEILHERPWIVFPGNTQGRHIKETGPKGCVVLDTDEGRVRHVALDVVRWSQIEIALGEEDDLDALLQKARAAFERARREADGRLAAARLVVSGACKAHLAITRERNRVESELRALTFEWRDELYLEEVRLSTRPPLDLPALRASEGFLGELLRAPRGDLPSVLKALAEKPELKDAGIDLADAETLEQLIAEAEALLATRLS